MLIPADPIAHYTREIEADPNLLANYWYLGLAWLLQGDEAEAQTVWFAAVTAAAPEVVEAGVADLLTILTIAATEQLQSGKFHTAERIFLQSLEIDATADIFLPLGSAVAQQGRYEEAIAHWQSAIDLQPHQAEAYRRQAEVWQKLGQWPEAIAAYTSAIEFTQGEQSLKASPFQLAETHCNLGGCLGKLGHWPAAATQFQQAIALDPENAALYGELGWALLQQQNWDEAIVQFRQAVALKSDFAQTYCRWVEANRQQSPPLQSNARLLHLLCHASPSTEPHATLRHLLQEHSRENHSEEAIAFPLTAEPEAQRTEPPTGFYETTRDWTSLELKGGTYKPLDAPHWIALTPPKTLEAEIHFSFRFGEAIELPETFVAEIPQGRFWLNTDQTSSAVIAPDHRLLGDLSAEFPLLSPQHPDRHPSHHSALKLPSLPPVQKLDGTVVVLSGLTNDLYFHWMLDVLPKWDLLQRSGLDLDSVDTFVVSDRLPFQAETLAMLGIPPHKRMATDSVLHIEAQRLIVPSYPGSPAWMPQWACHWLQHLLSQTPSPADARPAKGRSRLYISRSQTTNRRLINEAEVMHLLQPLGFEAVTLESLSVLAQAELLSHAEVVISPHGGGLTNLAFCRPGTKVIELFAPDYVYPCYWFISNLLGLEYFYLVGKTPAGRGLQQLLYPDARLADLLIDLEELRSLLHAAAITE
ncbi:MAG TPA: glycosyltransferase 61 family protein [Coleofasciculaceae cyanobacterium]|jgi:tetratricopeptide (TPR) repeat protein